LNKEKVLLRILTEDGGVLLTFYHQVEKGEKLKILA